MPAPTPAPVSEPVRVPLTVLAGRPGPLAARVVGQAARPEGGGLGDGRPGRVAVAAFQSSV
jgi:hypothetical protein